MPPETVTVPAFLTAAERNAELWPPPGGRMSVAPGTGAPALGDPAVERMYGLVGPTATAQGLADRFLSEVCGPAVDKLALGDPRRELPDPMHTANPLLGLATSVVGSTRSAIDQWRCGTLVPLPAQRVDGEWLVYLDDLLGLVAAQGDLLIAPGVAPAADLFGPTAIPLPADRKALPDLPSVLTAAVAALRTNQTAAATAQLLAPRLLANPYADCLTVIEALLQWEAVSAGDGHSFCTALVQRFTSPQLAALAMTTGGNAVLRRLWARLAPSEPQYATLAGVLGLVLRTPAGGGQPAQYHAPQQRTPSVQPVEPPLTADQVTIGGKPLGGITLGRRVTFTTQDSYSYGKTTYRGPADPGLRKVGPFEQQFDDHVPWPNLPAGELTGRRAVARRIYSEGSLDAVRLADIALLSVGHQQWSFHDNDEATVLLDHFRQLAPDHFDVFFGLYGMGLAVCDAAGKVDAAAPLSAGGATTTAAAVQAANPHAFTAGAQNPPADYYPTHVTVVQTQPDRDPVPLPAGRPSPTRLDYFGWTTSGDTRTASAVWAARSKVALQCSQPLLETELAVGVFRFTRIADDAAGWARDWTTTLDRKGPVSNLDRPGQPVAPTGLRVADLCGADHTLAQLFGSQWAAALVLDQHINAPAYVKAAIMRAWQRAVAATLSQAATELAAGGGSPTQDEITQRAWALIHPGGTDQLGGDFLHRFAASYAVLRGYKENGDWMKIYQDRTWRIATQHDSTLPATAGSFLGWG